MKLLDALANLNVRAFLVMLRHGEGTSDADGYRRMFGGKMFDSFDKHPHLVQTAALKKGGTLSSSAAGAYQFLSKTWDGLVKQWGFEDFSPHNQDLGAIALILGRKALDNVIAGEFDVAVMKCNKEWASLPGSPYGQPTVTIQEAREVYAAAGGAFSEELPLVQLDQGESYANPDLYTTPKGTTVAPFLALALPALFDAVPKLIKAFTSDGVTVPERNVAAVQIAVEAAKQAVNASNEQDLIEKLKNDPAAAIAVRSAIDASWAQITDASGVPDARKADAATVASGESAFKSPSFLVALVLVPIVYMIVGAVVGLWGKGFSEDVRAAIANGVVGLILGGISGYYWGQTTSRNRTQATPGN